MNILVVGNILKDVYLNLDSRTEKFEVDKDGVKWLDFGFNASEHHYFSRESSLGGAAVSLEVLSKMGINTTVTGSKLQFDRVICYRLSIKRRILRLRVIIMTMFLLIVQRNWSRKRLNRLSRI